MDSHSEFTNTKRMTPMWGRDIETTERFLQKMQTVKLEYSKQLATFPRTRNLLTQLDQLIMATEIAVEESKEQLIYQFQRAAS